MFVSPSGSVVADPQAAGSTPDFGRFTLVSGRNVLPPWAFFRVCVSVAVFLSTETFL
jgi:hypothetical protein